jgi:hypothetical protein
MDTLVTESPLVPNQYAFISVRTTQSRIYGANLEENTSASWREASSRIVIGSGKRMSYYFSQQSQNLYDDSLVAKRNRMLYENNLVLTSEGELNRRGNGSTGKSPIDPKLNYMNALQPNPLMLLNNPYIDVEKSELPENTHDFLRPIHNNRYNPIIDENVHEFNYFDAVMDDPLKHHSGLNPMYHESDDHIAGGQDQDDDWVRY